MFHNAKATVAVISLLSLNLGGDSRGISDERKALALKNGRELEQTNTANDLKKIADPKASPDDREKLVHSLRKDPHRLLPFKSELKELLMSSDIQLKASGVVLAAALGREGAELAPTLLEAIKCFVERFERLENRFSRTIEQNVQGSIAEEPFENLVMSDERAEIVILHALTGLGLQTLSKYPDGSTLLKKATTFSASPLYQAAFQHEDLIQTPK